MFMQRTLTEMGPQMLPTCYTQCKVLSLAISNYARSFWVLMFGTRGLFLKLTM